MVLTWHKTRFKPILCSVCLCSSRRVNEICQRPTCHWRVGDRKRGHFVLCDLGGNTPCISSPEGNKLHPFTGHISERLWVMSPLINGNVHHTVSQDELAPRPLIWKCLGPVELVSHTESDPRVEYWVIHFPCLVRADDRRTAFEAGGLYNFMR